MNTLTLSQAQALIVQSKNMARVIMTDGITEDIVSVVLKVFKETNGQVANLAKAIAKGQNSPLDKCRAVFDFVKKNIAYRLDPANEQRIPEPARILAQGFSDCKGYAILTSSLLNAMDVPTAIRFVSFSQSKKITHVYTVAKLANGKEMVIDPCLDIVGQEKQPTYKKDYMTKIVRISGPDMDYVGAPELDPIEHDALVDMKLHREGLALERAIASTISGPEAGALIANLDAGIADFDAAIRAAIAGHDYQVSAIGDAIGRRKGGPKSRTKRRGRLLKKVGAKLKKVAKVAFKVATLPQRLVVKGVLEVLLPKAGYFFIYLFITNPTTLASLPAKVKRKRKSQERIAKFVVNVIGFKQARFMKIVRNGIMRKYKQSPEALLKAQISAPITGIGVVADALASANIVIQIIEKLSKAFGKKKEPASQDDGADFDSDFSEASPKQKRLINANLANKTKTELGQEPADEHQEAEEREEQNSVVDEVEAEAPDTPEEAEMPAPNIEVAKARSRQGVSKGNGAKRPSSYQYSVKQPESTESGFFNGDTVKGLFLGGAAVLALKGFKQTRK